MVKVKVCGITSGTDAVMAASAGADAVGFNFWPRSPRYIDPDRALAIRLCLPPFIATVGLFVDERAEKVMEIMARCGLDYAQLHGHEAPGKVTQLKDVRVTRKESRTAIDEGRFDHFHEVELSVTNLGPVAVDVEVVDQWHPSAEQFHASLEPVRTPDDMLRWEITVEPGETEIIDYSFKVD